VDITLALQPEGPEKKKERKEKNKRKENKGKKRRLNRDPRVFKIIEFSR